MSISFDNTRNNLLMNLIFYERMIYINSVYSESILKPLKELDLINSFLFDQAMEKQEYAKKIAKIIIKRATGRELDNIVVETQKELKGIESGSRGIRMDVFVTAKDSNDYIKEVYDIEPNDYYEPSLARRTRFYNSSIDIKLLNTGEQYKQLPELISIWILTYDPFGDNRMLYTAKMMLAENTNLVYNDGVTNLFLYTGGKIGGSKELGDLLKHIEHTTKANAVDPELEQIQTIVDAVKSNKEVGERYMSYEKMYESAKQKYYSLGKEIGFEEGLRDGRESGLEEGRKSGLEEGIKILIKSYKADGASSDTIKDKLITMFDIFETEADEYITKYYL